MLLVFITGHWDVSAVWSILCFWTDFGLNGCAVTVRVTRIDTLNDFVCLCCVTAMLKQAPLSATELRITNTGTWPDACLYCAYSLCDLRFGWPWNNTEPAERNGPRRETLLSEWAFTPHHCTEATTVHRSLWIIYYAISGGSKADSKRVPCVNGSDIHWDMCTNETQLKERSAT